MGDEYEYKRALLFLTRKILVHASTEKFWCNGILLEVSPDFVVIRDRYDGKEKFIYFSELKKPLEPFTEKEVKDGNPEIN